MSSTDEWTNVLRDHPIFSLPTPYLSSSLDVLELSTTTLPKFNNVIPSNQNEITPSGRRQVMILKDADLILAAGKEIRISSVGDLKLSQSLRKSYKTLHTPSLQFEIHQIALNPTGKLLAVAGAFQIAVIVLPRPGYCRLVSEFIDCKSVQVGQFYHAAPNSAPIAKIEWHPWGEAGSTLLVMTVDGKLREYDISLDTEEPQQVLSFVPERRSGSFMAEDDLEREVASFTLGKGRADWGPLTVYAVMKSGDIYSICPYLPTNASVSSSYIHSLECFISAKQEFLSQDSTLSTKTLSTVYDYQRKYVTALVRQLPAGTVFPSASRSVTVHPPTTIKAPPLRQGPFLLQPSPQGLEGSEGGNATDISYLSFGTEDDDPDDKIGDTEHLGVVLVSFQDGKVDLFLDVEKVEARWDTKQTSHNEFPMLAVYETIDLGLVSSLRQVSTPPGSKPFLDLLSASHPVFVLDPLHDDMVYVHHAFGAHALDISLVLKSLVATLKEDFDDTRLKTKLEDPVMTNVRPILNTFSVQKGTSSPVIALTIPNDVYLTYSIFILTSTMRITTIPLNIRSESPGANIAISASSSKPAQIDKTGWLTPVPGPPIYVSLLGTEPYKPPIVMSNPSGLPANPKHSLPNPSSGSTEFMLTPDTLRLIGKTVAQITSQTGEIMLAYNAATSRLTLQKSELARLIMKCKDMGLLVENLKGPAKLETEKRIADVQEEQKRLLGKYDRLLQALMEKASPELSEYETKWFQELKRMKQEVLGSGKYDEDSLMMRIKALENEYTRLSPLLKVLAEKEKQNGTKYLEESQSLGFSQAFEYGELSNISRLRITALENKLSKLADRLDLSIGKPPSTA